MKPSLGAAMLTLAVSTAQADVSVERLAGGGFIARATPEGRVVGWATPRVAGGRHIVLLVLEPLQKEEQQEEKSAASALPPCPVETASHPLVLARLDLAPEPALTTIRTDLPGDVTAIQALARDGTEEDAWIALEGDGLGRVTAAGALEPLFEDARRSCLWSGSTLFIPDLHRVRLFRMREGKLVPSTVEITPRAQLGGGEIRLSEPQWSWIATGSDGSTWVAARPEPVGRQRLRVPLVLADRDGALRAIEAWVHLPVPEDLLGFSFKLLDGAPVLVAETKEAGKLGLFTEKRLRLYPLREDRTRLGLEPSFAVVSGMNLWQQSTMRFLDVTGDGEDDLVVGYWKGLSDEKVVLDVYRRLQGGAFDGKARTTTFDVKEGDRSFVGYGTDFDGDGLADLLVRSGGKLLLRRGRRTETGAGLVERDTLAFEAPGTTGEVQVTLAVGGGRVWTDASGGAPGPASVDLDGDGVPEILAVDRGDAARAGSITIVRPPHGK